MDTELNTTRISSADQSTPAWDAFVLEMSSHKYGEEETLDAWLWFKKGWSKASEKKCAVYFDDGVMPRPCGDDAGCDREGCPSLRRAL